MKKIKIKVDNNFYLLFQTPCKEREVAKKVLAVYTYMILSNLKNERWRSHFVP